LSGGLSDTLAGVIRQARWGIAWAVIALFLAMIAAIAILSSGRWDECAGASMGAGQGISLLALVFSSLAAVSGTVTLPLGVTGWSNRLRAVGVGLIPVAAAAGVALLFFGHAVDTCNSP
jgi:hypothetical protein